MKSVAQTTQMCDILEAPEGGRRSSQLPFWVITLPMNVHTFIVVLTNICYHHMLLFGFYFFS